MTSMISRASEVPTARQNISELPAANQAKIERAARRRTRQRQNKKEGRRIARMEAAMQQHDDDDTIACSKGQPLMHRRTYSDASTACSDGSRKVLPSCRSWSDMSTEALNEASPAPSPVCATRLPPQGFKPQTEEFFLGSVVAPLPRLAAAAAVLPLPISRGQELVEVEISVVNTFIHFDVHDAERATRRRRFSV